MPSALITGITGQDGLYLGELLLEKGYEVHGLIRGQNNPKEDLVRKALPGVNLINGDLTDTGNLIGLVEKIQPDEIYNLGAQSHVAVSFDIPEYTSDVNALGTLRLLEAIRILKLENKTKFYQASSSEMFGMVQEIPQKESTPFYPRSPYAVAKLYAYWITINYREAYGIFACNGILFNHEGTKRGEEFVTRKISKGVARIYHAIKNNQSFSPIELGNLDAQRDWSDSEDFVDGVWKIMNQEKPKDYVLSSNETHTIREFINKSFICAGIDGVWHGSGQQEEMSVSTEYAIKNEIQSSILVKINPKFYRPAEVELLLGNSTPARKELGWNPKISFDNLVERMVKYDIEIFKI